MTDMPHSDDRLSDTADSSMKADVPSVKSDPLTGDPGISSHGADTAKLDRAIVDNISSALLVLDNQLHIVMCNLRFCQVFDLPETSITGRSISDVFHDDTLEILVLQAVSIQESVREIEYTHNASDEDERQFLVSVSRLDDLTGTARALVTLDEITEWQQRQFQVMEASRLVSIGSRDQQPSRCCHGLLSASPATGTGPRCQDRCRTDSGGGYARIEDRGKPPVLRS